MSIKWVTVESVPADIFVAGNRGNGDPLGCARAVMPNGELTGGKYQIEGNAAYIPWGGKESVEAVCQVLTVTPKTQGDLIWVPASNGEVPNGAVVAGTVSDGSVQYVGRGKHSGELIPGKVVPSHNVCYVGTGWKEHSLKEYEVLVAKSVTAAEDRPLPGA